MILSLLVKALLALAAACTVVFVYRGFSGGQGLFEVLLGTAVGLLAWHVCDAVTTPDEPPLVRLGRTVERLRLERAVKR